MSTLRRHFPPRRFEPMTEEECIAAAPQRLRRRMRNAYESWNRFRDHGLSEIRMFLKFEKHMDDAFGDPPEEKPPRSIQHRSDEYCYELARYLKPIEKATLYKRCAATGHSPFVKGLTPRQVGRRIASLDKWDDTIYVLLDHSKYDAHLKEQIRCVIRKYFLEYYPGDEWLKSMLNMQRRNRGRSRNGIRYEVEATMMSGDYNTSLEDTLINYALLETIFEKVPHASVVNGDDSVVSMRRRDLGKVDLDFKKFGLTTKVEVVDTLEEVEFCQAHPVWTPLGWTMVRNPLRVLSRVPYTCRTYQQEGNYRELLASVALCERWLNPGIPVLAAYAAGVAAVAGAEPKLTMIDDYLEFKVPERCADRPIHPLTRVSFALAFGIMPQEQVMLERCFADHPPFCITTSRGA